VADDRMRKHAVSLRAATLMMAVGLTAGTAPAIDLAVDRVQAASAQTDGAALYRTYCASCHGENGRGDGPVAPVLRVAPPDLTRLAQRHGGTYPADRVAERIDGRTHVAAHGPSEMPVWGDRLASRSLAGEGDRALDARVAALVEHLRTLQARRAE